MRRQILRRYERQTFLADALIRPLPSGRPFPGNILDLDRGGVGLFTDRFVGVGQPVELSPPGGRITILGQVASVRVEPDGNRLGIAFQLPLSPQDLEAFRAEMRAAAGNRPGAPPPR